MAAVRKKALRRQCDRRRRTRRDRRFRGAHLTPAARGARTPYSGRNRSPSRVKDGYSFLLGGVGANAIVPSEDRNVPNDATKSFTPLSLSGRSAYALVVPTSVPAGCANDPCRGLRVPQMPCFASDACFSCPVRAASAAPATINSAATPMRNENSPRPLVIKRAVDRSGVRYARVPISRGSPRLSA